MFREIRATISESDVREGSDTSAAKTYKVYNLRHLHLREYPSRDVVAELRGVAYGKGERTLDGDFNWFGIIELLHSFDFCESHKIPIFESMSVFFQACDDTFRILRESETAV